MGFDLYFLPADRPITVDEAAAALEQRPGWRPSLRQDPRLERFLAEVDRRWPGLNRGANDDLLAELNVEGTVVHVGLGWADVERVAPDLAEIAWRTGLAVYDPQREVVGMPQPLADAPLGADGLDRHVATAEQVIDTIVGGVEAGGASSTAGAAGDSEARRAMSEQLRAIGATRMSPLGFEVTEDIEDEVLADITRVPSSLQTAAWRDDLVDALGSDKVGDRHRALVTLGGWDRDDVVAAALRPLVMSDDVAEVGLACAALARQGDITDLPAVLNATYRLSPADGGTADAMIDPLRASLLLATQAGPDIVAGVKSRARDWRGTPRRRRYDWEASAEAELDELLAD